MRREERIDKTKSRVRPQLSSNSQLRPDPPIPSLLLAPPLPQCLTPSITSIKVPLQLKFIPASLNNLVALIAPQFGILGRQVRLAEDYSLEFGVREHGFQPLLDICGLLVRDEHCRAMATVFEVEVECFVGKCEGD